MTTVTLPLWVVIVASVLAAIGLLDRLLVPTARWFLRRRVNRAIALVNAKLKVKIPPFKVTKRKVLINNLMFDSGVLAAVELEAQRSGEPTDVVMERARRYAREIVPAFSTYAYFNIGTRMAKFVSRMLYRVRLGAIDDAALDAIPSDATVVFVMNHRSNMDYVLVTYVAASSSALSYAVGEWARVWMLQSLIRLMGGYFVRRDSSNPLYRKVLSRYVQMSTMGGVTQAVFPEGGLSQDGALQAPKLGLLSYMLSDFDPKGPRDIMFVPVGINYDRVLEDRILVAASERAKDSGVVRRNFKFNPLVLVSFLFRNAWQKLTGRWYRFGYAAVSFGRPVSLRDHLINRAVDMRTATDEQRRNEIERLGMRLIGEVGGVVPVLPVSLVASALVDAGDKGLSGLEIKTAVQERVQAVSKTGAYVHIPREDLEYAVEVGMRQLRLRHLIVQRDSLWFIAPDEHKLVSYYANSISHLH